MEDFKFASKTNKGNSKKKRGLVLMNMQSIFRKEKPLKINFIQDFRSMNINDDVKDSKLIFDIQMRIIQISDDKKFKFKWKFKSQIRPAINKYDIIMNKVSFGTKWKIFSWNLEDKTEFEKFKWILYGNTLIDFSKEG